MTERDEIRSALTTATRLPGELRPKRDAAVLVRTRARRRRRRLAAAGTAGAAGCLVLLAVVLGTGSDQSRTAVPATSSTPTATVPTPSATGPEPTTTTKPTATDSAPTGSTPDHYILWPSGPRTFAAPIEVHPVLRQFPTFMCPNEHDTMPAAGDASPAANGIGCYQLAGTAMEINRVRDLARTPATGPDGNFTDGIQLVLTLTESDALAWETLTRLSVGKQVALVVDGRVYSAPAVAEPISGGMIALPLSQTAIDSLLAALSVSTGQTDPALVPEAALQDLRDAIHQLTVKRPGMPTILSARLVNYELYRWGTANDFTLLVTFDLHFPTRNTAAWNEGGNGRFITFTKAPGDTSYRLDWATSP